MKTNANQPTSPKSATENEANYHKEMLPNVRILTDQVTDVKLRSSGAIKKVIRIPTFTQVHNCSRLFQRLHCLRFLEQNSRRVASRARCVAINTSKATLLLKS